MNIEYIFNAPFTWSGTSFIIQNTIGDNRDPVQLFFKDIIFFKHTNKLNIQYYCVKYLLNI